MRGLRIYAGFDRSIGLMLQSAIGQDELLLFWRELLDRELHFAQSPLFLPERPLEILHFHPQTARLIARINLARPRQIALAHANVGRRLAVD